MATISMKSLLESGVHFGHQVNRWDPRMKRFIFSERNGIHIIDLQKTSVAIREVYGVVRNIVLSGKMILFVGTKKQAQVSISSEAERCGMFYMNQHWLGGTLTNFATIRNSIQRLKRLEKMEVNGTFDLLSKKEVSQLRREKEKLARNLDGIKEMRELPGAVFIVDTNREHIAVAEARRLGIPVIAVVDTNSNPDLVDYPLPGNDDAVRAISFFTRIISDAVLEADKEVGIQIVESLNEEDEQLSSASPQRAHEHETDESSTPANENQEEAE